MTSDQMPGIFGEFLVNRGIPERIEIYRKTVQGLSHDQLVQAFFVQIFSAADQMSALFDAAIELGLTPSQLSERAKPKYADRTADYLNYQFQQVIQGLDGLGEGDVSAPDEVGP